MIKLLTKITLLFSIIAFASSCNSSNDEVQPEINDNVVANYLMTTAGLNSTKQFVSVYNLENVEVLEELKSYDVGSNEFINVYLEDGTRVDLTDIEGGTSLFDVVLLSGVSLSDIGQPVHSYKDQNEDVALLKTSIKVVHEIVEDVNSIIVHENLTTVGIGSTKQSVTVYDANESINEKEFDQYVIGENKFVNIYLNDSERVDVKNVDPTITLKQLLEDQGINYNQLSNNRHQYRNENGELQMIATSIKVVID
ncbi:hypothetical protein [Flammeovirga pacifica]|uniref:Uncharacterized protein n=1 Tax=Flammeovirga pacifica TaxID=915059 RepID=A0A1S1Z251_FLAPC|nr:hypothetical protein [Flammeovirga pacifica]OHX67185.1 hypothetical protein NH26_12965 [Flammeovirga pacifica]